MTTPTLPCNTDAQCAFLRFVREAIILGTRHGIFEGNDRRDFVRAVRAADIEACTDFALGVVCEFLVRSNPVTDHCGHRFYLAPYLYLRDLGRQANIIPPGDPS
jgi:hypothetical protein